jgi:hypothetical protein
MARTEKGDDVLGTCAMAAVCFQAEEEDGLSHKEADPQQERSKTFTSLPYYFPWSSRIYTKSL